MSNPQKILNLGEAIRDKHYASMIQVLYDTLINKKLFVKVDDKKPPQLLEIANVVDFEYTIDEQGANFLILVEFKISKNKTIQRAIGFDTKLY